MTDNGIPTLLGSLTHDLIVLCNPSYVVLEANTLAQEMLGTHIVGQSLLQLLHEKSQMKGQSFLKHLSHLAANETSNAWELVFYSASGETVMINVRAGLSDNGNWLLVGTCESPQLTALYHEVLAMNSELTNLIRQLSKEQARLNEQLSRLLDLQEHYHG